MNLAKVTLIGRLGNDPTVSSTKNNKKFCYFTVATNKKLKDGTKETAWHFVNAWEKVADICEKYLHKGSCIYLEGELRYKDVVFQDGKKGQTCSVNAKSIQFLDTKKQEGSANQEVKVGFNNNSAESDYVPF